MNGTYEIEELFGGGNGFDKLPDGKPNPGANVGYKNYTVYEKVAEEWVAKDDPAYDTKEERTAPGSAITYGTGQASVNVFGGTVHRVFGGSNTKGNVRQTAVTLLDENSGCSFCVDRAYGGGRVHRWMLRLSCTWLVFQDCRLPMAVLRLLLLRVMSR